MKKVILLALVLSSFVWLMVACQNTTTSGQPGTVTSGSSATATPTSGTTPVVIAATVGAVGNAFSPNTMTITHGQAVVFNSTLSGAHTVYVDGFSGDPTPVAGCGTPIVNTTTFPVTVIFSTAGTYDFHCANHSGCNNAQCGICLGGFNMVGSVTVN
jgi:plastocyanin